MWSFLQNIKDTLCGENFTQQSIVCNTNLNISSCFVFNKNIENCFNIKCGDTLEIVIQKIHNYLCSPEQTTLMLEEVANNIILIQEFTQLINNLVTCEQISLCLDKCIIEATAQEIIT